MISATEQPWRDDYLDYYPTLMTVDDKTLTAARFNSLRFNIGSRMSTGISEVKKGDPVLGKYFTTLTDVLNEWIDSINSA